MDLSPQYTIRVNIAEQRLYLYEGGELIMATAVATAKKGPGERRHSECTPRGQHYVRAKIGADAPLNSVFVARRPTGEIYTPRLREQYPRRDWILTRILWLSGLEPGKNRLGEVDTMRRFVYIHGCPDEDKIGEPGSRGCIKMRNADVVKLFDIVPAGTPVYIEEK